MNLIRIALKNSILASIVLTCLIIDGGMARSQQRACVITDEGTTVCGKLTTVKKDINRPTQSSGYRKEVNKFVFLLKGCRREDANIKCDLVITNKGLERELVLNPAFIKMVDSMGKSHQCVAAEIGSPSDFGTKIAPGVDYAASMTFNTIPAQISQAQLVEINTSTSAYDRFRVQFRKVSFSN